MWASALVQALLFSSIAPLLPTFEKGLGLSKAQAGLLVAMFPVGQAAAALPVALLAARAGVKQLLLAGLTILAVTSAVFGLVDGYAELLATRLVQGAGAAVCFSAGLAWLLERAADERRGELIGVIWGANAAGNLVGPAVGGLAVLAGRGGVFAGVAAVVALLAVAGARLPGPARGERQSLARIRAAHRAGPVRGALALVAVPSLLFGTSFALMPLELDRAGWGPVGVAGTFLAAAAAGVLARPSVGRWADRQGLVRALRVLLLAAVPVTFVVPLVHARWVLCACVVAAVTTYGLLLGPALALVSRSYQEAGLAQVLGFALVSLTVGIGFFAGSAAGGEIAHVAGDAAAFSAAAGTCLAALVALGARRRAPVIAKPGGL